MSEPTGLIQAYAGGPRHASAERRAPQAKRPRKDIQGLRALAVIFVVLNHLWPNRLPGGYVGVDVFFVISGYLISNHLLNDLNRSGSINLGKFYARRAKRLLPAALLVAIVGLALSFAFLPFDRWVAIGQETIGAAFYVENWVLAAKSVNYSAHSQLASTVQHYWSLSVEEQFYILWPLLLLGLFWLARRFILRSDRIIVVGMSVLAAVSLIFCVLFTAAEPSQAYFVTPGRAWEFAAGGVLAALEITVGGSRGVAVLGPFLRGIMQSAGLLAIVLSGLFYNESTPFPGLFALLPVAGTVLVVASGPDRPSWSFGRLLEWRPAQYVGDISYSVYLWHWPLIILAPSILGHELSAVSKIALGVLSIVLAAITKRYVEDPCRTTAMAAWSARRVLFGTAGAMAAVGLVALSLVAGAFFAGKAEADKAAAMASDACFGAGSLVSRSECPDPFGPPRLANVGENEAPWFDSPECMGDPHPVTADDQKVLVRCDFTGGRPATRRVWLIGDSHAEQWKVGIHELAKAQGWQLTESLVGGCPLVDVKRVAFMGAPSTSPSVQSKCLNWSSQLSQRILSEKPDLIFVSGFGSGEKIDDGSGRSQQAQYESAVKTRFGSWIDGGAKVISLRDTPMTLDHSSPECVALNHDKPLVCANQKSDALPVDPMTAAVAAMNDKRARVLDLSDFFCPDSMCYAVIGGVHVYYDKDHVTRTYIRSLTPELIRRYAGLAVL
ncbi:acyltransferase family protein [Sinomonas sp. ASV322]|uniref:acyltransferase family protein n=1 Tax=Sinomonas sp. ASV322 TaxID=3041920 RepID=UPI0027DB79AB|nr:acyltransferase family protein [Sinomonas sp. ASV322]MDQ4503246.1 acyltransferase family protein [Sinomonas sp. ASV322]